MPTETPRRTTTLRRSGVAGMLFALVTTGCALGERPELETVVVVDDAAAAVVLERLERADSVPFTASYDIIPSSTGETTVAIVRQLDDTRRVTIGDVDYLTDGGASRTCRRATGDCVDGLDDALISDLNITNRFWSDSIASRLTVDAARRVGFSEGHTETIAGQPAACADVPVLGGVVVYCALDAGVLARFFNADVSIELTSFSSQVDAAAFESEVDPEL